MGTLRQYELKSLESGALKVCWLDGDLKVGSKLTFRGEKEKFEVIEKYDTEVSPEFLDLNRNPEWYSV